MDHNPFLENILNSYNVSGSLLHQSPCLHEAHFWLNDRKWINNEGSANIVMAIDRTLVLWLIKIYKNGYTFLDRIYKTG